MAAKTPAIKLGDKTITAPKPKTGLYREFLKSEEDRKEMTVLQVNDEMVRLIAEAFKNPDVTEETILKSMDLENFVPLFYEIQSWVTNICSGKIKQLPNGQTPAGT